MIERGDASDRAPLAALAARLGAQSGERVMAGDAAFPAFCSPAHVPQLTRDKLGGSLLIFLRLLGVYRALCFS